VSNDTLTNAIAMPNRNLLILFVFIYAKFVAKATIRKKCNNNQTEQGSATRFFLAPIHHENEEIFQTTDC
jgi:hypothetical protein